ncbi:M16 family metallopeptidase [Paradesertivirga mongoliensis]|uniref:M16 family metallopeptidase n=1 Tax=Paradesertivirga mongoliensis TaxID=2100740 RepID=A0ABW4ZHN3_9SPHI|nr:pitrilysin family protein [Pedobacter mongoliensis]
MDYQVFSLPNGIRLLHKSTPSLLSHACIIINAGSRDEKAGKDGLAHFIEHLLFKKTEKRSTNQILNRLELVGGDLNAYTTKEYTCIHASFLNAYLERAIELFQDLVFHSVFPEEELVKEKSVILDEIASYQDQPEEAIQDDFEDLLFAGHALGRNILGTSETVKNLQRPDILNFIESNYNTHEIVVGVLGNYDFKKLCKVFTKLYSHIPENKVSLTRAPVAGYQPQLQRLEKTITQTHCIIGNQAYSIHHKNKTGLLLLNNLLGGTGMSSRLNLQIREKHGIAYTIESNYTAFTDTGIFSIYFGTDAEKSKKAHALVMKELKKLRENKLSAVALHQAKQKFTGLIALGEENRIGLIISMSKSLTDYGKADTLEEIYAKVNAVTSDQVLEIANEIFDPSKLTTLVFEPSDEMALQE